MTTLDLDAIKTRCERVTVGPWQFYQDGNTGWVAADDEPEAAIAQTVRLQDAEFVAHARADVPALVAEVERQAAVISEALGRVRASSIPLGMSEQQFNAATILDTAKILSRPAVERTSDSDVAS